MSLSKLTHTGNENLRSLVRQYFSRDKSGQFATCSLCKSRLKSVGGTTRSLHVHLQSKHKIALLKRGPAEDDDDHDSDAKSSGPSSSAVAPTAKQQAKVTVVI